MRHGVGHLAAFIAIGTTGHPHADELGGTFAITHHRMGKTQADLRHGLEERFPGRGRLFKSGGQLREILCREELGDGTVGPDKTLERWLECRPFVIRVYRQQAGNPLNHNRAGLSQRRAYESNPPRWLSALRPAPKDAKPDPLGPSTGLARPAARQDQPDEPFRIVILWWLLIGSCPVVEPVMIPLPQWTTALQSQSLLDRGVV